MKTKKSINRQSAKNICLISLGFILFTSSCLETDEGIEQILGTWNWVSSTGGIAGNTITPESSGNEIFLEISENEILKYENEILILTSGYSIKLDSSLIFGTMVPIIVYDDGSKQSIQRSENKLLLFDECLDCYQHEYGLTKRNNQL
jgi:hypothetical protein